MISSSLDYGKIICTRSVTVKTIHHSFFCETLKIQNQWFLQNQTIQYCVLIINSSMIDQV